MGLNDDLYAARARGDLTSLELVDALLERETCATCGKTRREHHAEFHEFYEVRVP